MNMNKNVLKECILILNKMYSGGHVSPADKAQLSKAIRLLTKLYKSEDEDSTARRELSPETIIHLITVAVEIIYNVLSVKTL